MSAWIVAPQHCVYLARAMYKYNLITKSKIRSTAQMLLDECVKSVGHRYGYEDEGLPGYRERKIPTKLPVFMPEELADDGQVLKSAQCYAYQSCEHPGWEVSEANVLTQKLLAALPPGTKAEGRWGYPGEPR